MELPRKRRGGREAVDARTKLLHLLENWVQDFWPLCVGADERGIDQLKQQGEAWLLDQIEKWEVDSSPSRNHKLKVRPRRANKDEPYAPKSILCAAEGGCMEERI